MITSSKIKKDLTRVRINVTSFFSKQSKMLLLSVGILAICIILGAGIMIWSLNHPPESFPEDSIVAIEEGSPLSVISQDLFEQGVIKSPLLFRLTVMLTGGEKNIIAGDYYFEQPASAFEAMKRFVNGDQRIEPWKVTIPEGTTIFGIARILENRLPDFDPVTFFRYASQHRGYLFPDTYNLTPRMDEEDIVDMMRDTFAKRIEEIEDEIEMFGKPIEDVVVMASILEEEGRFTDDRRMIAGVLWKRIEIDMPLQVDAAFIRVNGKGTYDLTYDDLALENPFNTYKNKGLPPQPITNPGLDSLKAAVTPIKTENLYYLNDLEGNIHYSETFEEHKQKKAIYVP